MRIGYCTWSMRQVPIVEAIPAIAAIGYAGIELAVTPGWPTDLDTLDAPARKRIADLLVQHNLILSAVAGHTSMCEDDPDLNAANLTRLRASIDLAAELTQAIGPVQQGGKRSPNASPTWASMPPARG